MRGIDAAGSYVPAFRLSAAEITSNWGNLSANGVETKAIPAGDEDAVTMGVAAAERALANATVDRSDITGIGFGTTTPPLAEEMLIPRITRMLGLPGDVATFASTQSTLAGAEVFARALDTTGPVLVIVADSPIGDPADTDHPLGAGAAAFVVTDDPVVVVRDQSWHVDEIPGIRFREHGSTEIDTLDITTYERTAIRESVATAIAGLDESAESVAAASLYQPDGRMPYRITRGLSFDTTVTSKGTVADRIGDAGAAGVPLGLLAALDRAGSGDRTIAGFFASGGGAAAFLFEGGFDTPTLTIDDGVTVTYGEYLRKRGFIVRGDVAGGGAHVSLPSWRQTLIHRYRLRAGKCPECGELAFPPDGACPTCQYRGEFESVTMPRRGTICAVTSIGQGGAPPEFSEQQQRDGPFGVAIVELSNDEGRIRLPCQLTDTDPTSAGIGDPVRAVFRRVYEQEGVPRYGLKFTAELPESE